MVYLLWFYATGCDLQNKKNIYLKGSNDEKNHEIYLIRLSKNVQKFAKKKKIFNLSIHNKIKHETF